MMYPIGRGEKGIFTFWAVSRQKLTGALDFSGGAATNVVLGKARMRFKYKKELEESPDPGIALEHMEKSVIANLATNVRVSVKEGKIVLIVDKSF